MAERMIKTAVAEGVIGWTFEEGLEPLSLDMARLADVVKARALVNGIIQTVGDAGAMKKGTPLAQRRAAMEERIQTLLNGAWEKERQGGGPRPFDVGQVVTALARVKFAGNVDKANLTIDAVAQKRNIGRVEAAKLFAADEKVAEEISRMKIAARPTKLNADDLLAEVEQADTEEEAE